MIKSFTLAEVAAATQGTLHGDGQQRVTQLVHPKEYQEPAQLILAMLPALVPLLANKADAYAVLAAPPPVEVALAGWVVVARPRLAMAQLTNLFAPAPVQQPGIHPSAIIHPSAEVAPTVEIGPFSVVGPGAKLATGVRLVAQNFVGEGASLGANTVLQPGVRVGHGVQIGARCLVHANAVIGADGFSFVTPEASGVEQAKAGENSTTAPPQRWLRIASLGGVVIGDDVEIGANTSIDRGTIMATKIGRGTKIDNGVQIGHNVQIGEDCLLCGQVGVAGSVEIGNRVVIGGRSGVADHLKLGDDVVVMGASAIANNIQPKSVVGGTPAQPREKAMAQYLALQRLPQLAEKVNKLVKIAEQLELLSKTD